MNSSSPVTPSSSFLAAVRAAAAVSSSCLTSAFDALTLPRTLSMLSAWSRSPLTRLFSVVRNDSIALRSASGSLTVPLPAASWAAIVATAALAALAPVCAPPSSPCSVANDGACERVTILRYSRLRATPDQRAHLRAHEVAEARLVGARAPGASRSGTRTSRARSGPRRRHRSAPAAPARGRRSPRARRGSGRAASPRPRTDALMIKTAAARHAANRERRGSTTSSLLPRATRFPTQSQEYPPAHIPPRCVRCRTRARVSGRTAAAAPLRRGACGAACAPALRGCGTTAIGRAGRRLALLAALRPLARSSSLILRIVRSPVETWSWIRSSFASRAA